MRSCILLYSNLEKNKFSDLYLDYSKAIGSLGYHVTLLDYLATDFDNNFFKAIDESTSHKNTFVLSFDSNLVDLNVSSGNVYDIIELPIFSILTLQVDNYELYEDVKKYIRCVIDKHEAISTKKHLMPRANILFLPSAARRITAELPKIENRPIDVLFCGEIFDATNVRMAWKDNPEISVLCDNMVEILLSDENKSAFDAFYESGDPSPFQYDKMLALPCINYVNAYMQSVKTSKLLKEISGLTVYTPYDAKEYLSMIASSKIVLNTPLNLKYGITDEMACSMANGSICASETNEFTKDNQMDNLFLNYSNSNYSLLNEKIKEALISPQNLNAMSESASVFAENNLSVLQNAKKIIEASEIARLLNL